MRAITMLMVTALTPPRPPALTLPRPLLQLPPLCRDPSMSEQVPAARCPHTFVCKVVVSLRFHLD